jgi:hypothetical protein
LVTRGIQRLINCDLDLKVFAWPLNYDDFALGLKPFGDIVALIGPLA